MTALYRKWRSRSFDDLYGQEHVVRTLRNAIRQGRAAHAYLFTGPRGTGKTSTARILAKAVNCLNPHDGNPCTQCSACVAAQEGRALDVIEIDAASNTSVENVRDLRERVAYAAGEGRYKVYIIDEVHRLSGQAFDAFLKTLEEPPPHVIFVFASTEPHKVPATIASRCQRFDFRRISPATVETRLREIVAAEGMEIADGAIALLANSASGSLRDALSLLDQAASYTEGAIDEESVRRSLGLADPGLILALSRDLIDGNAGAGLELAQSFFDAGGDPGQLMQQLVEHWRALLFAVAGAAPGGSRTAAKELQGQAAMLTAAAVVSVLEALTGKELSAKYSLAPTLSFELAYARAALAVQPAAADSVRGAGLAAGANVAATAPGSALAEGPTSPPVATARTAPLEAPPPGNGASARLDQPPGDGSEVLHREPQPVAPLSGAGDMDMDRTWTEVVARMRDRSRSLQALLRSGYLLKVGGGEVTVGFLHSFHRDQFVDPKRRRLLEEVVREVLGSSHRVECVHTTKAEIERYRGAGTVEEDDGFVEEVAERLRQYHARQINNGTS